VLQVDGTVVIFDIETNGVARKLQGHTRQIQSLRYVLEIFLVKSGTNTFE
jgi:hypothetical protein